MKRDIARHPSRWLHALPAEWIPVRWRSYRLACCDCGLVHRINWKVVGGKLRMQLFRDPENTRRCRRYLRARRRRLASQ